MGDAFRALMSAASGRTTKKPRVEDLPSAPPGSDFTPINTYERGWKILDRDKGHTQKGGTLEGKSSKYACLVCFKQFTLNNYPRLGAHRLGIKGHDIAVRVVRGPGWARAASSLHPSSLSSQAFS